MRGNGMGPRRGWPESQAVQLPQANGVREREAAAGTRRPSYGSLSDNASMALPGVRGSPAPIAPEGRNVPGKDALIFAAVLRSRNKTADALALYDSILEVEPQNVEAHVGKGICLRSTNLPRQAFECFANALRLDAQNACALTQCGILYQEEGQLLEAAEAYRTALMADPTYKAASENLAIVLTDLGTSLKLSGHVQGGLAKYYDDSKAGNRYAGNTATRTPEMAHVLQFLESALLDDDDDEGGDGSGSLGDRHDPASEGSWADALEELLAVESGSPGVDCSTVTSASTHSEYGNQYPNGSPSGSSTGYPGSSTGRAEEPAPEKLAVETRSRPEQLLVACAEAVSNDDMPLANVLIAQLNQVVSIYGDPMQRLAAYMVEGLVARVAASGSSLYKALKCKEPAAQDLLSAMQILYEVCPYFKFGYMSANGAIAEAFQNESRVHVIDFEIAQGSQWTTLIQALAARPGGPPHLRITGVDNPTPGPSPSAGVEMVGKRLGQLAEAVGVPFAFHPVAKKASEVEPWMLERQPGEALAVNFALNLHHIPDESVCTSNPRDRMLHMLKSLSPKVVTLVEQEANTNTAPFYPRFLETMSYYSAVFESLDITLARDSKERVNVEQQCLARDIVNVIACEGAERVERHEMTGKWRARLTMAGFKPYPLSHMVNNTIRTLLESYSDKYRLKEEGGALFLGWRNRDLIVCSAWH